MGEEVRVFSFAAVRMETAGGTDFLLARTAEALRGRGVQLAGVVQTNTERGDRLRCDMHLTVLPSGKKIRISQDRGEGARGCHLDHGALEDAVAHVEHAILSCTPDLVIINKFGRREAQGGGFVPVICAALEAELPVLVGVNNLNRTQFDAFACDLARALPPEDDALLEWCFRATG